jgi:hypothetical protein
MMLLLLALCVGCWRGGCGCLTKSWEKSWIEVVGSLSGGGARPNPNSSVRSLPECKWNV